MKKNNRNGSTKLGSKTIAALCLLVLAAICATFPTSQPGSIQTAEKRDGRLRLLKENYFAEKAHNSDQWWLEQLPRPNEGALLHGIISNRLSYIKAIIEKYQSVSPFAGEIGRHFGTFYVTLAIDRQRSVAVMTDEEQKRLVGHAPELTFIARDRIVSMSAPYAIYWRSDWGMMMNAVDHPTAAFAGFLFHELGHGFLHPVLPGVVNYETQSREYILEECRMHELETLVNDAASDGKFKAVINKILKKAPSSGSFREVFNSFSAKDLETLDRSLGATDAGMETISSLFAQYLMAVGLEYIRMYKGTDDDKVELFRWAQTILR